MKIKFICLYILQVIVSSTLYAQDKKNVLGPAWDEDWAKVDRSIPFYINGNVIKSDIGSNVAFSVLISPFSPALKPVYAFVESAQNKKENKRSYGFYSNFAIKDILQLLYGLPMEKVSGDGIYLPSRIAASRTTFRDIDSTNLVFEVNGIIDRNKLWSIQLTSSVHLSESDMRQQMINAIEMQFGLDTFFEKQLKKCAVISRSSNPISDYKEGKRDSRVWNDEKTQKGRFIMNKMPLYQIVAKLERHFRNTGYPIVDETNFKGTVGAIDLQTEEKELTFNNLGSKLEKYGFKITMEDRLVDMLIITKRQPKP